LPKIKIRKLLKLRKELKTDNLNASSFYFFTNFWN
jgi:hypothetical protein